MSSPLNDQTLAAATRLKAASTATGGTYPTVAHALAGSDLSTSEMQAAGSFVKGLDTSMLVQLANQSGASVGLSAEQQDHLAALGQTYTAINSGQVPQEQQHQSDPRSWLSRTFDWVAQHASNTMQALTDNKPMHYVFEGLNDAVKAVKYPFALLSNSFDGGRESNDIQHAMQMEGYDPTSQKSYLAFMFNKSDSAYHDMSGLRGQYGDAMVDLAIKAHQDPEAFSKLLSGNQLGMIDGKAAADVANSDDFQKVSAAIDQHAISPGRDLANLLTHGNIVHHGEDNGTLFKVVSGALDATFDIAADPTLILGKVSAGMRALDYAGNVIEGLQDSSRFSKLTGQAAVVNKLTKFGDQLTGGKFRAGLENALDTEGMRALITSPSTKAGQQATGFIQAVNDWRATTEKAGKATGEAADQLKQEASARLADMSTRYKQWMPFFDEVNGRQVLSKADETNPNVPVDGIATDLSGEKHMVTLSRGPITDVHQFADYLAGNQGLLRMANGIAAKGAVTLPGRVSLTTRLMARRAAARAAKDPAQDAQDFIIDHSRPGKTLPNEVEESVQERLDAGYSQDAKTGDAIFNELRRGTADGQGWNPIKQARAKFDQTARRWSTFLPTTKFQDLNGADAIANMRRVARMYLPKAHADSLASAFAAGNTGVRRQIYNSIIEQSFHASGLSRSEEGRGFMQKWRADQDALDKRAYGLEGTDVIKTPAGDRHVAMVPSQIAQHVTLPDFKHMSYVASKSAAAGWMGRTYGYFRSGVQSPVVDALMGAVKMGWITTPAGGARNALDEVVGHVAQKQTSQMVKGRALYNQEKARLAKDSLEERARAGAIAGHLGGRVPNYLRGGANNVRGVVLGSVLGKLASFTHSGVVTDARDLKYATHMIEDEANGLASEAVTGAHFGEDIAEPFGNDATVEAHGLGVAAQHFRLSPELARQVAFDGWKQVELDGGAGLDAWVGTLHQYFADPQSPARVALRAIMEDGDPVSDVIEHMQTPAMRHFMADAEVLNTVPGTEKQVATQAEKDLAVQHYAHQLSKQVALMLRGRGRDLYDDDLVEQARNWKAQGLRDRAAADADARVAGHGELVNSAEEAQQSADELTARHQQVAAVHRAYNTHDKAQAEVDSAQAKLDEAHAQLQAHNANTGETTDLDADHIDRLDAATAEVDRLGKRVDDAATRRDRAKRARATNPATKVKLQERVKAARADLRRAQNVAAQVRADIPGTAEHEAARAAKAERLSGKVDRHADRIAGKLGQADDASADLALAQHDTGITGRPTDEHVEDARFQAVTARNRASYLRKRVETNARMIQARTLDSDHAYAANGHVDDEDIRKFLRETGQAHKVSADPLQGGAPRVEQTIHPELAERLLAGDIPDRAWLKNNVPMHQRPEHTVRPTWAPVNPAHTNVLTTVAQGYTGLMAKAFNTVVEKPVAAFSRNPMRMSAYVQARKTLEPYEQMLKEHGFADDIAEQTVRRMANTHADQLVLKSVDNATVRTQFEMMSRNWWSFVRAQGDWLRRWSRIVKENPTVIRKAQIALHGGMSAGMLDKDPQTGQLSFVYPGSGYAINALTKLGEGLGIKGLANIPIMPDLRTNLTYLNPSADNPLGYSSTPIVSVPFHIASALLGSHAPLLQASADQILNGQLGAGRAWYEQFMPSYVNRIFSGIFQDPNTNPSDAHSQLGSAMHSAMINLAAAGRLDDPRLQYDPSYRQQFLNDLQTQTKTHMAMRALLGFFLPAPPSNPTEDVQDAHGNWVNRPDFTAHQAGLASLTDEARQVFGNMPYADAMAYWAKYHPDRLPFEQGYAPETQAGSRDAVASATIAATQWMQENPDFVAKFGGAGGLATYFMPAGQPGSAGGQFSQLAYNAQLEQGMRKYLSTTDQFNNLLIKHAENFYFNTKQKYDDAIASATAVGDKATAKQLDDQWSQDKQLIYATNPLLAEKFTGFASNGIMNTEVVDQLNEMLAPENLPMTERALGPDQVSGVAKMLVALRNYSDATDALKGQSSPAATAARSALKSDYADTIKRITTALPGLADLANGAFKAPN